MRRDERTLDPNEGESEIEAIEAQWTRKWDELGGPKGDIAAIEKRIRWREEFGIIDPIVSALPQGARFLDGGCGMGEWTVYFTRRGFPTAGLDVSRKTIGVLQSLFPDTEFKVGDIRATGYPDNTFDLYFSWGTFEHFEEGFGPVVQEAFRVLKPGGVLLTSMPFDNLRIAWNAIRAPYRIGPKAPPTRFYQWRMTRAELARVLAKEGFEVEDVHIIGKRQGLQRLMQHALGMSPTATVTRGIAFLLAPFVPKIWIGHMVLAVARKRTG
ncbi:class I SAM-dependent methyltransferase [Hyphomicrobium sp.]|uniref:class I SAM-dependent methyltransferase n=1 Tax=Hyphomicrobium sp. TaxID=82 RepID=UPI0025C1E6BB|nr:class I SAM-dependent methyltransferase [Hyphomicrobium sp.]MCC7251823.1 methyltransferase domain-containing protein [Hyphomicrobium sp.]